MADKNLKIAKSKNVRELRNKEEGVINSKMLQALTQPIYQNQTRDYESLKK